MEYEDDFEEESSQNSEEQFPSLKRTSRPTNDSEKTPRKRGQRMLMHNEIAHTSSMSHARSMCTSTDRVISAKKRTIHVLQNHLAVIQRQLDQALLENKLLKRVQFRQERELTRINHSEGQLPQILYQHSEEVRAMREHLNKSRKANGELQRKVVEISDELTRMRDKTKKFEAIIHKRGLLDRETLTFQLQDANDSIAVRDRKIRDLERTLELTSKNHTQEVKSLHLRQRELMKEVQNLREEGNKVKLLLKEKGKELDVMNIYSQRRNVSNSSNSFTQPSFSLEALTTSSGCQTKLTLPPHKPATLKVDRLMQEHDTQTEGTALANVSGLGPSLSTPPLKGQGTSASHNTPSLGPESKLNPATSSGVGTSSNLVNTQNPALLHHSIPLQNPTPALGPYPNKTPSNLSNQSTNFPQSHSALSEPPAKIAPGLALGTSAEVSSSMVKDHASQAHSYQSTFERVSESTPAHSSPKPEEAAKTWSRVSTQDTNRKSTQSLGIKGAENTTKEVKNKPDITEILFGSQQASQVGKPAASVQSMAKKSQSTQSQLDPEKKKQLLAKLMEIDTSKNLPSKLISNGVAPSAFVGKDSAKNEHAEQKVGQDALPGSSASLLSQEEKIENMHKGRPSFSTENDPYGTKLISTVGNQKPISASVQEHKPKHGRRAEQAVPEGSSNKVLSDESAISYQPSFGRRAGASRSHITSSVFARAEARSDSQQLVTSRENKRPREQNPFSFSSALQDQGQSRDYPWEKKVNAGPAGVVTSLGESDDVEELAL